MNNGPATGGDLATGDACALDDLLSLSTPRLSAVVETVNIAPGQYTPLDCTLAQLEAQTIPKEQLEIIVVIDTAVHPALKKHVADLVPSARIIETEGMHYYAQKNLGAAHARAPLVGFIDSDCLPGITWAESIIDAFARHDDRLGAVQGTVWTESDASIAKAFLVTVFGHLQAASERLTPSLATSNCAFRRADIVASPFEEMPVFHGPDVRMRARLGDEGKYVLLVPGAADRHAFEPELKPFLKHGVYWGYCFLNLRRDARPSVPYARLFRRLGPLAPLALVPAKAMIDLKRMFERRADLRLTPQQIVSCSAALLLNSLAVGYGAMLSVFRITPSK
ncbi:MAG TPA: glycosyltransferase [Blastocatellia bacterium]|nr:glycosyltransferase [Blastocatellia bacterium]